jgi:hypothetical protein
VAASNTGIGVDGEALSSEGASTGVRGVAASSSGVGVLGQATAEAPAVSALPVGVRGESTVGIGVVGAGLGAASIGVAGSGFVGVAGDTESQFGRGLSGRATSAVGTSVGVYGESGSPSGFGGSFVNVAELGPGLKATSGVSGYDIVLGSTGASGTNDDGVISTDPVRLSSDLVLVSYDDVEIHLNEDDGSEFANFIIRDAANSSVFRVSQNGEVYADGTFHTGGADLAELLPATDGVEEGDVLAVGPSGRLEVSSAPYQTAVVGVYSSRPGVLGGRGTANDTASSVPLAVLGVVRVKASAENGAILAGDLLTTAATPGHAMRCGDVTACTGALIGKALQPLSSGLGAIEMLVSLH